MLGVEHRELLPMPVFKHILKFSVLAGIKLIFRFLYIWILWLNPSWFQHRGILYPSLQSHNWCPYKVWFWDWEWWCYYTHMKRYEKVCNFHSWGLWAEQSRPLSLINCMRESGHGTRVCFIVHRECGQGEGPHVWGGVYILWISHGHQRREHLGFHFSFLRYGTQTKEGGIKYNIKNAVNFSDIVEIKKRSFI